MNDINDRWQIFTKTGKISDYLKYVNAAEDTETAAEMSINDNDRRYCDNGKKRR